MLEYDPDIDKLIEKNLKIHKFCHDMQIALSTWVAEPIVKKTKWEKFIEISKPELLGSSNQGFLTGATNIQNDLPGTKLAEIYGALASSQTGICKAESELFSDLKNNLLGVANTFENTLWPPLQKQIDQLEEYRTAYDLALKRLAKHPPSDKKNKAESAVLLAKDQFTTTLENLTPMLEHISETEDALINTGIQMSKSLNKYYKRCAKHASKSWSILAAEIK